MCPSESPLPQVLRLERNAGTSRWAYSLRSETMHALYTDLEQLPNLQDTDLHERFDGEGFLAILERKFESRGVDLLDEPETPCRSLAAWPVGHLHAIVAGGSQVIVATHSPVVASLPGARILDSASGASAKHSGRTPTSSSATGPSSPRPSDSCTT